MASMQRQGIERRYTDEEVGEIIRLASRLDDNVAGHSELGLTLADISRIASELGIDEAYVTEAANRYAVDDRKARRRSRMRGFWVRVLQIHALIYATAIAGFAVIDLATGSGFDFVQYPAVGWGVLLGWQAGLTWLLGRSRSR